MPKFDSLKINGTEIQRLVVKQDWEPFDSYDSVLAGCILLIKSADMYGEELALVYHIMRDGKRIGEASIWSNRLMEDINNHILSVDDLTLDEQVERIFTDTIRFVLIYKDKDGVESIHDIIEIDRGYMTTKTGKLSAQGRRFLETRFGEHYNSHPYTTLAERVRED